MGGMASKALSERLRRIAHRRAARRRRRGRDRRSGGQGLGRARVQWSGLLASLPGLAALLALLFTWMQVSQANKEIAIIERGQVTNRFNAAIGNLGSDSADVRLGGIYALERLMHDSARDHPTVVSVLSAYVRRQAPVRGDPRQLPVPSESEPPARADIQAVLAVLSSRDPAKDPRQPIDLSGTSLRGVELYETPGQEIQFRNVDLTESDLSGAAMHGVDLSGADLSWANLAAAQFTSSRLVGAHLYDAELTDANLEKSDLREAYLADADLTGAWFCSETVDGAGEVLERECGSLKEADLTGATLTGAGLSGMNLSTTEFCPPDEPLFSELKCAKLEGASLEDTDLTGVDLAGANLKGARLNGADLTGADLSGADLTKADFTGATTAGATFKGARTKGSQGLPPSVTAG